MFLQAKDMSTQKEKQKILSSLTTKLLQDRKTTAAIMLTMNTRGVNTLVMDVQNINNLEKNTLGVIIPVMSTTEKTLTMSTTGKVLEGNTMGKTPTMNTMIKINAKLKFRTALVPSATRTILPREGFLHSSLHLLLRIVPGQLATRTTC